MINEWADRTYAEKYLANLTEIPHRAEGESTLLRELPTNAKRILDLGCGNGHLLALTLSHCPDASGVGLDMSPTMLEHAGKRFAGQPNVELVSHDLNNSLPDLGSFDVVVSSFAIHHCEDERKQTLYGEIAEILSPGGVFCNLEHVSSPSERLHNRFLEEMGSKPDEDDPSNRLLDVETQLSWLRELAFVDVDCYWKWRELALLVGHKAT